MESVGGSAASAGAARAAPSTTTSRIPTAPRRLKLSLRNANASPSVAVPVTAHRSAQPGRPDDVDGLRPILRGSAGELVPVVEVERVPGGQRVTTVAVPVAGDSELPGLAEGEDDLVRSRAVVVPEAVRAVPGDAD